MPHVDELLGPATFAAAGLVAAIALQPAMSARPSADGFHGHATVASLAKRAEGVALLQLPTIDVVARRSVELARIERERQAKPSPRPSA
jgi:hypothetical protein